jgi:hypothetical protein
MVKATDAREGPVFSGNRSMPEVFPENPETWHLTNVFEKTVRRNPDDRCHHSGELLQLIKQIRRVITAGYPPLEHVKKYCPSCGSDQIGGPEYDFRFRGQEHGGGITSRQCVLCGFVFARQNVFLEDRAEELKNME